MAKHRIGGILPNTKGATELMQSAQTANDATRAEIPNVRPNDGAKKAHRLVLEENGKAYLSGVREILRFDEQSVFLELTDRRLSIDGENLKIEGFCRESGEVTVDGKVSALCYYDDRRGIAERRKNGIFGKWFSPYDD